MQDAQNLSHRIRLLDVLERISQISMASENMQAVLSGVLDMVLEVFNADRAWFLYPCDPDAKSWGVRMERTRPEWPGLFALNEERKMDNRTSDIFRQLLSTGDTIQFTPDQKHSVPRQIAKQFEIKSQMMIALRPKIGNAWVFGLHHCDKAKIHNEEDMRLFTAIAHRVSEILGVQISSTQLRESEKRSQGLAGLVIDQAGALVVVLDKDGRIVRFNRASERLSGYTCAEAEGKYPWDLLLPPEDADSIRQHAFEALAHHPQSLAGRYTNYWLGKNGERHLIEWVNTMLLDAVGNMEFMVSVGTDVTERQRVELALRESEARFRAIIEATPVPLALNDEHGNITYLNKAFVQTIGYTIDDIPTLADWWPRAYPDSQYRQSVSEGWLKNMEEAKRSHKDFSPMEINVTCKDGLVRTFMVGAASLKEDFAENHLVILYEITQRKAAEEEIKNLAYYDTLTHLPNRRYLQDRLKQALASSTRSGREGALLFIDLDNFKTLNDTLGHDTGDLLLQQVAERLPSCVRKCDTVGRLGGDEFVVILENLSERVYEAAAQTQEIGENILASLNQPYLLGQYQCYSTSSIGVALFNGHDPGIDELMKHADIAMYQSKKAGRNTLRFFDPKMQGTVNARVALESELRKALEKQQFRLHYQIQVDDARNPLGAEALIRWIHPEHGLILPAEFIPLAEETGLILPIGQWVLQTACAQLKAWQLDAKTRDLALAVNVSTKQFRQPDFVAQIETAILHHAINPKLLKLELTESLLLDNIEDTIVSMNALNEIGVQFSLDDFGTGYSSLQYLRKLPLNQLKIDRSFITDIALNLNDETIVHTIIAMAHSLNLDVIAEGVETEYQRKLLLYNGCTHYQGYLFGRPVAIEQFNAALQQ